MTLTNLRYTKKIIPYKPDFFSHLNNILKNEIFND